HGPSENYTLSLHDAHPILKQLVIGIFAHVDAGKTTLSEALLYCTGQLRRLGRVDHRDAFLDTDALERERGITIFAKQAVLEAGRSEEHTSEHQSRFDIVCR